MVDARLHDNRLVVLGGQYLRFSCSYIVISHRVALIDWNRNYLKSFGGVCYICTDVCGHIKQVACIYHVMS